MDELPIVPTLIDFLRDVAAGAWGPAIVSFLLEHIPAFQNLASEAKKWTVMAIFVILPVGAQALLQYVPAGIWATLEPFWNAMAIGFASWMGSQLIHKFFKKRAAE